MFSPVHNVLDEAIVPDEMVRLQVDFASVQYVLGIWIAQYWLWKLSIQ